MPRWSSTAGTGAWRPRPGHALVAHDQGRSASCCQGCGTSRTVESTHHGPPPASLGRHAGARAAVFMVSGISSNAEAAGIVCAPSVHRLHGCFVALRCGSPGVVKAAKVMPWS